MQFHQNFDDFGTTKSYFIEYCFTDLPRTTVFFSFCFAGYLIMENFKF